RGRAGGTGRARTRALRQLRRAARADGPAVAARGHPPPRRPPVADWHFRRRPLDARPPPPGRSAGEAVAGGGRACRTHAPAPLRRGRLAPAGTRSGVAAAVARTVARLPPPGSPRRSPRRSLRRRPERRAVRAAGSGGVVAAGAAQRAGRRVAGGLR